MLKVVREKGRPGCVCTRAFAEGLGAGPQAPGVAHCSPYGLATHLIPSGEFSQRSWKTAAQHFHERISYRETTCEAFPPQADYPSIFPQIPVDILSWYKFPSSLKRVTLPQNM